MYKRQHRHWCPAFPRWSLRASPCCGRRCCRRFWEMCIRDRDCGEKKSSDFNGIRCILIARLRTLPFGEPGIRSIICLLYTSAGWLNSNGAVKHTAACEKSYISGVIRKVQRNKIFRKHCRVPVSYTHLDVYKRQL